MLAERPTDVDGVGFVAGHARDERIAVDHRRNIERQAGVGDRRSDQRLIVIGILGLERPALAFPWGSADPGWGRRESVDEDVVGPEFLEEDHDALAQAGEQRRHGHHGGDADHDAEDGEQRAELVGPHRVHGHLHVFAGTDRFMVYSARSATTGSSFAARDAGYQPDTIPPMLETAIESTT